MTDYTVRALTAEDHDDWRAMFDAYGRFYKLVITDAIAASVWGWLHDSHHVLQGLIARDATGDAAGLAHIRANPRPLGGCDVGFLDDLFVEPAHRGRGVADALFAALADLAREKGWPHIRWTTQEFNYRGRAFYDRYTGSKTDFIVYQWPIEP